MIKFLLRVLAMSVMFVSAVWLAWCFWSILIEGKVIIAIEPIQAVLIFEVTVVTLGACLSPWLVWRFIKRESIKD